MVDKTRLTVTDCLSMLQAECERRGLSRLFIVIDAIDECSPAIRPRLLSELRKLQPVLRLLITSRPNVPGIQQMFEDVVCLDIQARDEDIGCYIDERIENDEDLRVYVSEDAEFGKTLKTGIVDKAKGMSFPLIHIVPCIADTS